MYTWGWSVKVDRCPRCGNPGYLVEDHRELKNGHQVYYFIVHRYKDDFGKWRTRKCAIGSIGYINVTKTHKLPLLGIDATFSNVLSVDKHVNLIIDLIRNLVKRPDFTPEHMNRVLKAIKAIENRK